MENNCSKYEMSLDLNILNHLGINLYSNVSAVISEVIANAWDADATEVKIDTSENDDWFIKIQDNGEGMNLDDINNKFLKVGYQKRAEKDGGYSKIYHRPVMGRKGIGKLSLFAIADEIEIYSVKNSEKSAFLMSIAAIKECIKNKDKAYHPVELDVSTINFSKGTLIKIKSPRKDFRAVQEKLRTKIARRFSILSDEFIVKVNGKDVTIEDRNYFSKIKYMWHLSPEDERYYNQYKFEHERKLECQIEVSPQQADLFEDKKKFFPIKGWIGSVSESGDLKKDGEDLNKITVMMRGKVAKENILDIIPENRLFKLYLIGELHIDIFDDDKLEEMATSGRQDFNEDDPRFQDALKKVTNLIKTEIAKDWNDWKDESGTTEALANPTLKAWFDSLGNDSKKQAKKLFGRISKMTLNSEDKKVILKHSILAFERLKLSDSLSELDNLSEESLSQFNTIFNTIDSLEAVLYHDIIRGRVGIIKELAEKIDRNEQEKVIQKYLFGHLWLLDPSWERAIDCPASMEKTVEKVFEEINDELTEEEKNGRIDITYKVYSGKHLIIELKRPERSVTIIELVQQTGKYINAFKKMLEKQGNNNEDIEAICILGKVPQDWKNIDLKKRDLDTLKAYQTRVVFYDQLITNSLKAYGEYMEKKKEITRIQELIESL